MPETNEAYHFYCSGLSYESEEEAWKNFDYELKLQLKWIRGYKYWRLAPNFSRNNDFDTEHVTYRVYSRIIAFEKPINGLVEVSDEKPYPTEGSFKEPESQYVGFGGAQDA